MISKRIQNIVPSATTALTAKLAEMRAAGADVIGFNVGEPDFATPKPIADRAYEAICEGKTKYEPVAGILSLRKAICRKLADDNGLSYQPNQIVVSTGAKLALFNALMALCDDGDEVILPIPCWVSYVELIKLAGGVPVLVKTAPDYSLDLQAIEEAITPKTKVILLNTPNNPTGAVYSEGSLRSLGKMAEEKGLYIISDEVYEKLVYGDAKHFSIAQTSEYCYEHTIVVNGMSKAFSMTGWRIGYTASTPEIAKGIIALQSHVTSHSTSFVQYASVTALQECAEYVETMRKAFEERRNLMHARLTAMEGVHCSMPDGAFYLMPDISCYLGKSYEGKVMENSMDLCDFLLTVGGIAVVPGDAFYMPGTVRFSYATSVENIGEGMARMEKALKLLK